MSDTFADDDRDDDDTFALSFMYWAKKVFWGTFFG